jgi:hypothetical protein
MKYKLRKTSNEYTTEIKLLTEFAKIYNFVRNKNLIT